MYRRFLRPGWFVGHLMVLLAVLVCLRLGWWQWDRTHDADGTVQNLGYAVLWPVFGGAFIYMWVRFLQLELLKDAEDDATLTAMAAGDADEVTSDGFGKDAEDASQTAQSIESDPSAESARDTDTRGAESFETEEPAQTELTPPDVGFAETAPPIGESRSIEAVAAGADEGDPPDSTTAPVPRRPRSRGYTVAIATVGDENEIQDPELAAYNRALAALAAKDRRRAR